MNKKLLICSVVCSLMVTQGWAADDVYVDLSVLDSLPKDSIGFIHSSPAFPEFKKPVVRLQKKAVSTRKGGQLPSIKKSVAAVEIQPVKPQLVKHVAESSLKGENKQNIVSVSQSGENTSSEVVSTSLSHENKMKEENISSVSVIEKAPSDTFSEVPSTESNNLSATSEERIAKPVSILPQSAVVEENTPKNSQEKVLSANASDEMNKNRNMQIMPREVYSISFVSDSSELSEESIRYLEEVIGKFDKEQKKKISIKAYNYDDGIDSFRKKRVSLLRATQVRSYLLSRGFKNFSIKIINTTVDSEDKNSVEIEEIN